jgi:hypothetical protein
LHGFGYETTGVSSDDVVLSFNNARKFAKWDELAEGPLRDVEEADDASACTCRA